jgi:hypothetical protein
MDDTTKREGSRDEQPQQREEEEQPPSYSIAKELDVLAPFRNVKGLALMLDWSTVKLQHDNDQTVIYSVSQDPQSGQGDSLTYGLSIAKNPATSPTGPEISQLKQLYTAKKPYNWLNSKLTAYLPPQYVFEAEARSNYCYRPSFEIIKGNWKLLRWTPFVPFFVSNHLGCWRINIPIVIDGKSQLKSVMFRRKSRGSSSSYEWGDMKGKVIAVEAASKMEFKSELDDRQLLHALVFAWLTIIWNNIKNELVKARSRRHCHVSISPIL